MTITSSIRFFLFLPIMECRKQRIPLISLVKKKITKWNYTTQSLNLKKKV